MIAAAIVHLSTVFSTSTSVPAKLCRTASHDMVKNFLSGEPVTCPPEQSDILLGSSGGSGSHSCGCEDIWINVWDLLLGLYGTDYVDYKMWAWLWTQVYVMMLTDPDGPYNMTTEQATAAIQGNDFYEDFFECMFEAGAKTDDDKLVSLEEFIEAALALQKCSIETSVDDDDVDDDDVPDDDDIAAGIAAMDDDDDKRD